MTKTVEECVADVLASGRAGAIATVVRTAGSTPQVAGAKLLLLPDGSTVGTVGGGAIEEAVVSTLRECVVDGRPRMLVRELGYHLGMCCGGRMELFVEKVETRPRLFVFGAGHVAEPAAAMAERAGFDVTIVDSREALNTSERFPACTLVLDDPSAAIPKLGIRDTDWALVVTHDHRLDEEALEALSLGPHRYIGVIGSRRKIYRIVQRLYEKHGSVPMSRVYAPVGLDIGAVTPAEIAVAIVAELVLLRHGKTGAHLRALDDPHLTQVLEGRNGAEAAARAADEEAGLADQARD